MLPFNLFFAALIALTVIDAWSTYKGLKSGRAAEANPVARKVFDVAGVKGGIVLIKAAVLALVWFNQPIVEMAMWLLLAFYAALAINNLRVLRKAGVI
jgi:Domain of unknown function (DUF5658)